MYKERAEKQTIIINGIKELIPQLPDSEDIDADAVIAEVRNFRKKIEASENLLREVIHEQKSGEEFKLFLGGMAGINMQKREI